MRAYALQEWFFGHFQSRACMYGQQRNFDNFKGRNPVMHGSVHHTNKYNKNATNPMPMLLFFHKLRDITKQEAHEGLCSTGMVLWSFSIQSMYVWVTKEF